MQIKPDTALNVSLAFTPNYPLDVGRLVFSRGTAYFQYSEASITSDLRLNPLAPSLDSRVIAAPNPRAFGGLHGIFADSLPDAWGTELLRRRAISHGIDFDALTPLDRLACVGSNGPGALTYRPEIDSGTETVIDVDLLAEESLRITAGQDSAIIETLARLGGSSGGARPKVLVAMNAAGHLISSHTPLPEGYEAWIIKFRGSFEPIDAGPREAAYADMARAAGLTVAETRLITTTMDGPGYFATKRFDWEVGNRRYHLASAAAVLETAWEIPSFGYEELLKATNFITRHEPDVLMMYRRMIFNVLAHNRDDHAKQHAYLMTAQGVWHIAPSYDLTFSSGPGGEHYLTVKGLGTNISRADFESVAKKQGINLRHARQIIDEVATGISRFAEFATTYGVSRSSITAIQKVLTSL